MKSNNNSNSVSPIYENSDCHPIEANNHNDTHEITEANNNKHKELDNVDNNRIVFSGLCNNDKNYNRINVNKDKSTHIQMLLSLNESIFISSSLLLCSSSLGLLLA